MNRVLNSYRGLRKIFSDDQNIADLKYNLGP